MIVGPVKHSYTIYTKSNCIYCDRVKNLLEKEKVFIVNCDEYLDKDRDTFLEQMDKWTLTSHRTFPFVFSDQKFIGGFDETCSYYQKKVLDYLYIYDEDF